MVQIYDIKIRFMRRVQVREYEPAEAEVTLSAQVSHDEDAVNISNELMLQARDIVKTGLTGSSDSTKTKKAPAKKTTVKKASAKKVTVVDDIPEDDTPKGGGNISSNPENRVNPEDDIPEETKTKKVDPVDDIPDEEMTARDLQDFIGASVTSKKIKPRQIKEILAKYKATRIFDVPAENRADVKKAIKDLMDS